MGNIYLDWLADESRAVLSDLGLDPAMVIEVDHVAGSTIVQGPAWRRRARSSGGYQELPLCVMHHHTAVSPHSVSMASMARHAIHTSSGRPVANIYLWDDGTVLVMAGGATNTNGKGRSMSFSRGTVPTDGMNSRAIGLEIMNNGVGEPYPQVQIDVALALSNRFNARCGNRPDDVCTHHHYAPNRKIDPARAEAVQGPWRPRSVNRSGSWDLDDLRAELLHRADGTATTNHLHEEDDDMAKHLIGTGSDGSRWAFDPEFKGKFALWTEDVAGLIATGQFVESGLRPDTVDRIPGIGAPLVVDLV